MLSNAYFLAKFRFDTAENEPAKNSQKLKICKISNLPILPIMITLTRGAPELQRGQRARHDGLRHRAAGPRRGPRRAPARRLRPQSGVEGLGLGGLG